MKIKKELIKYNFQAGGNAIKYVVLHDTGNKTDSDEANAKYFSTERKSSAHYFVDGDSITQIINDYDRAWHVGDGKGMFGIKNNNSIGVEMCRVNNKITKEIEDNTLELVVSLMKKYNLHPDYLVRHYDASRKNCPSAFADNDWERWKSFKEKVVIALGLKRDPYKMPVLQFQEVDILLPEIKLLQEILIKAGYLKIPNPTGYFKLKTKEAVVKFQEDHGLHNDGVVGPKTWEFLFKK